MRRVWLATTVVAVAALGACATSPAPSPATAPSVGCAEVVAWGNQVLAAVSTPPQYKISEAKQALLARAARDGVKLASQVQDAALQAGIKGTSELLKGYGLHAAGSDVDEGTELKILQGGKAVVDRCAVMAANDDLSSASS